MQEIKDQKWDAAIEHIRTASASEHAVPMIELTLAKMLEQEDHVTLLSTYLPVLEKMDNLPEALQTALELATRIVRQDLLGDDTFDHVLEAARDRQKDVVIRVFFSTGKFVLEALEKTNRTLQGRFSKALELTKYKEAALTIDTLSELTQFAELVTNASELHISKDDFENMPALAADAKALATAIVKIAKETAETCDVDTAFRCFHTAEAMSLDAAGEFFAHQSVQNVETMSKLLKQADVLEFFQVCSMDDQISGSAQVTHVLVSFAPWLW